MSLRGVFRTYVLLHPEEKQMKIDREIGIFIVNRILLLILAIVVWTIYALVAYLILATDSKILANIFVIFGGLALLVGFFALYAKYTSR